MRNRIAFLSAKNSFTYALSADFFAVIKLPRKKRGERSEVDENAHRRSHAKQEQQNAERISYGTVGAQQQRRTHACVDQ